MKLFGKLFGYSPFDLLQNHILKVSACVGLVEPLFQACVNGDAERIHQLQDEVSRLEYEADVAKHEIRDKLVRQYILPVDRSDIEGFLHCLDTIADYVEDFAVVLYIRRTILHSSLIEIFHEFLTQTRLVAEAALGAAAQIGDLARLAFQGPPAVEMLETVNRLGEGEWLADKLQRKVCQKMYQLEKTVDPITLMFYEKMLATLSGMADAAENTGDHIRHMIMKSQTWNSAKRPR